MKRKIILVGLFFCAFTLIKTWGQNYTVYCAINSGSLVSACAPCTPAAALFTVIEYCFNEIFNIEVNTSNLGTASALTVFNGTTAVGTITSIGTTNVGPFQKDDVITLKITDSNNSNCSITSTTLTANCVELSYRKLHLPQLKTAKTRLLISLSM